MKRRNKKFSFVTWIILCSGLLGLAFVYAEPTLKSSYSPVVMTEPLDATMSRMKAAKPEIMKRQMDLLNSRYDLSDRPAKGLTMSRGKAVQEGVRVKLPEGMTWESLPRWHLRQSTKKTFSRQAFSRCLIPTILKAGCSYQRLT